MKDLTIIFYSANKISDEMMSNNIKCLKLAAGDIPIVSVTHVLMNLGTNVVFENKEQCHLNIYKQLLLGAKLATTKYIATAEDDTFYHKSHFEIRPSDENTFTYNMNKFSYFTWSNPPIFSDRNRKTLNALIAPRIQLIEALKERFNLYPDESKIPQCYFAEPGRNVYERHLGVKEQKVEESYSEVPIIMVNHSKSLNYYHQGKRKRLGDKRTYSLPFWGDADKFAERYL